MTGVAEASAIYGLITGSIGLIKLTIDIYRVAEGRAPERIEKVAEQLPSIQQLLENARDTKSQNDGIWKTVEADVVACEKACNALKIIFDKAFPESGSGNVRRIWNAAAVIFTGKRSEAEGHIAVIYKTFATLNGKLIITNTVVLDQLRKAVDELDADVDERGMYHWGSGDNITNESHGTFNYQKGENSKIIGTIGTYNEPPPAKKAA